MLQNQPNRPSLATNEVHVWAVPLGATTSTDQLAAALTADETHRAQRFLRGEVRERFIISHGALRTILGRYLGVAPVAVPIEYGPFGKPKLQRAGSRGQGDNVDALHFNLSHSGELAIMALACGSEIGVDVEQVREVRHRDELAKRYFAPSEIAAIKAADQSRRDVEFFAIWTAKEAILKAIGTGISYPLDRFAVSPAAETQWVTLPNDDGVRGQSRTNPLIRHSSFVISKWWLARVEVLAGYVAAVATESPKDIRPAWRYPEDLP